MEKRKEYKTVIFDLDGTLYFQKPFRICMAKWLAKRLLSHPGMLKDIRIIMKYRKTRENWQTVANVAQRSVDTTAGNTASGNTTACNKVASDVSPRQVDAQSGQSRSTGRRIWSDLDRAQYIYVAGKMHCAPEKVAEVIQYYMQEAPLSLLPAYRDDVLAGIIEKLQARGIQVAIYSDYPVEDKLKALQIEVDKKLQFAAADEVVGCMKPDPQGLANILQVLQCQPSEALMVGDRMEKDGLCAESNQVDYVILETSRHKRMLTEEKLEQMLGLQA